MYCTFTSASLPSFLLRFCSVAAMRALGLSLAWTSAFAQTQPAPIPAKPEGSAYQQDSQGIIVRSSDGLCWRTGYWTPKEAVAGCDGALAPPISKMIAPPVSEGPAPTITTQTEPAPIPTRPAAARCDFSFTLGADQSFPFNSSQLSAEARQQLDQALITRLNQCTEPAMIRVTGHTDRLGSARYNQLLSLRRAQAVAAYLNQQLRQPMDIETIGAGASQALQQCPTHTTREVLLACLAPDRKVTVEVHGTRN